MKQEHLILAFLGIGAILIANQYGLFSGQSYAIKFGCVAGTIGNSYVFCTGNELHRMTCTGLAQATDTYLQTCGTCIANPSGDDYCAVPTTTTTIYVPPTTSTTVPTTTTIPSTTTTIPTTTTTQPNGGGSGDNNNLLIVAGLGLLIAGLAVLIWKR